MRYTRPYQICTKTVMDTSDPDIRFDADGVSHHYHEFYNTTLPRWQVDDASNAALATTVAQIKAAGAHNEFDCLIGLSGGADSSYMLHKMVRDHGLRPLVFHVDAGWNSEIAVHNINCLIEGMGLHLYTEVVNWQEVREFQLAMLKSGTPYLDLPQDIAFIGVLFQFAAKFKIGTILNGGNISTECVSYPQQYYYFADMTMVRDILDQQASNSLPTYPFTSTFYRKIWMPYVRGVKMVKPLNMMPYPKAEAMDELRETYGWKPYTQKHFESRMTRFFEGYWLPTRFGYDVRRVQFSSMILTGQMTRDEAIAKLEEPPYDPELIQQDFDYIATKLGITAEELRGYHAMPKRYYWDYKNRAAMFEFGEKVMVRLAGTKRGGAH